MDRMLRDKKAICIFIAPGVILFTAILLGPILYAVYISFCDWNALSAAKFVGLSNYFKLLINDDVMKIALKNSIFFTIFSLITQQIMGLFLAVILSNIVIGKNFFKNIYYLPCVLSSAALGLLFSFFFNPRMGLNQVLAIFNIEGPLWLMSTKGFFPLPIWVVSSVACWQYVGTTMMLYMAAIVGIPNTLYEASYIDGANKWDTFKNITLPLIKPMAKTTISLTCIGSLKFFDLIYNMTEGGPNNKTEVLATHLYKQGFEYFKYGYASAIAMLLLVLSLTTTFVINKSIKVDNYEM